MVTPLTRNAFELYESHKEEVDILSDERALFLLAFLQESGHLSMDQLLRDLPWERGSLKNLLGRLERAGMINAVADGEGSLHVTPMGENFLNTVLYTSDPGQSREMQVVTEKTDGNIPQVSEFLRSYEEYVERVLVPTRSELALVFREWTGRAPWVKDQKRLPIRSEMIRIKQPEAIVDEIVTTPSRFPDGLTSRSLHQINDSLAATVTVHVVQQLSLLDAEIRRGKKFEVSQDQPPIADLPDDLINRLGLADVLSGNGGGRRFGIRYVVRLRDSVLAPELRPWFNLRVRSSARTEVSDNDQLNAENLPTVLAESGLKVNRKEIDHILKLARSRGFDAGALRKLISPGRLDRARRIFRTDPGRSATVSELLAILTLLDDVHSDLQSNTRSRRNKRFM